MTGHGGNIYRLAEELGVSGKNIIDFSASINPLGIPDTVMSELRKKLAFYRNYPDPDCKQLVSLLAKRDRVAPDSIICGNGSTELIYLVARVLCPRKILIPAPTFSEYERACKTAGYEFRVMSYELKEENAFAISPDEFIKHMQGCNMAFLCNPNNPTGKLLAKDASLKIAGAARKYKCYLVIDEAFMNFCPENSLINEVRNNPYLIILRSMTKFYALSGFRIGYGVFPRYLIPKLKEHKEPWTVNSLAQKAAEVALKDRVYRERTFRLIKKEKRFLEKSFRKIGLDFFGSAVNFYLLRTERAGQIYEGLRRRGMLVRDCSNFAGLDRTYIRIAVKSRKENAMLLREIGEIMKERIP